MKNTSTKAHLWFEEAMSGDESINVEEDVYGLLNASVITLETVLEGGDTEVGEFLPVQDNESIKIIRESITDIQKLVTSAKERWEFRLNMLKELEKNDSLSVIDRSQQAGGVLDQKFDADYEELQETYDRLTSHVKKTVAEDNRLLNNLSWTSIVLMIIIFSILCVLLYRIQLKTEQLSRLNKEKLKEETTKIAALSSFVQLISKGDFDHDLAIKDELGIKLLEMRDTLKANSESESRRNWSSVGMAQIGEILRSNYDEINELYDRILQFTIQYTNSNQGFLFLINDSDEEDIENNYLELSAAYAFDRKKFMNKKIMIGEGMVGQAYLEGKTTLLLDFPIGYINITSGLGDAPPNCLILVPLKINEVVFGILEIASFHKYQPFEIELIEKFAESIASTISSVRNNEKTKLLLEQTQQQAEEMRAQEEEMRQNLEELSATQEEMKRTEHEYVTRIRELEATFAKDVIKGDNS